MATHSSVLAWRIPWTEAPGRLEPMRLQRVGHYRSDLDNLGYRGRDNLGYMEINVGLEYVPRSIWLSAAEPVVWEGAASGGLSPWRCSGHTGNLFWFWGVDTPDLGSTELWLSQLRMEQGWLLAFLSQEAALFSGTADPSV